MFEKRGNLSENFEWKSVSGFMMKMLNAFWLNVKFSIKVKKIMDQNQSFLIII